MKRSFTSTGRKSGTSDVPSVEFELDGVAFTGDGAISPLDLAEFARLAAAGVDSDNPAGAAIIADVFLGLLGERTYQRFRTHCRRNGTDDGDLVKILQGVMEDAGERPTERPSDSSAGPPTEQGTAKVVSLSKATVKQVPIEEVPQQETETAPAVRSYG